MPKQQIEFIIKPDGSVTEKVSGVEGTQCEELTRKIEERLGEAAKREHTPEYWQQQQTHGRQSASTGGDIR